MGSLRGADTPQQAPAQQPAGGSDDRRSKQSKSSAAALAAAAMLKVMCLKEMADAQRENDSEKMSKAMMMCAQADAMAQNGKENEEGSKKSGSGSVAAAASPQFEKPDLNTEVKPDEFDSSLLGTKERNSSSSSNASPDSSGTVKNSETLPTEEKGTFSEDKGFSSGAASASNKGAPLLDSGKLSLNEGPVTPFPLGGILPDNNSRSPASLPSDLGTAGFTKPDSASTETAALQKEKGGGNSETNSGAPSGNGFDEMLAKYMGAGATSSISSASLSGGIVDIAYGLKVSGERPKTIFEFASEQYKQKRPTEPNSRTR